MESKDPLVEALRALCDANGGYKSVADKARVSSDNLWQILAGVKLKSGKPRGVGPNLRDKLTAAYPGWMNRAKTHVASEPAAAYNEFTERERALLDNFRVLPDEDQVLLFADIEARAGKTRAHIEKVLRGMGLSIPKSNTEPDTAPSSLPTHTAEQQIGGYPVQPSSTARGDLAAVKRGKTERLPTPAVDRDEARFRRGGIDERSTDRAPRKSRNPRNP